MGGRVQSLQGFGVGGWRISYPLPDGLTGEFTVAYTRPSALREGMQVVVLVEASNPHNARLDDPGQARVFALQKRLAIGVALAIGAVGLTVALTFGVVLMLVRR